MKRTIIARAECSFLVCYKLLLLAYDKNIYNGIASIQHEWMDYSLGINYIIHVFFSSTFIFVYFHSFKGIRIVFLRSSLSPCILFLSLIPFIYCDIGNLVFAIHLYDDLYEIWIWNEGWLGWRTKLSRIRVLVSCASIQATIIRLEYSWSGPAKRGYDARKPQSRRATCEHSSTKRFRHVSCVQKK